MIYKKAFKTNCNLYGVCHQESNLVTLLCHPFFFIFVCLKVKLPGGTRPGWRRRTRRWPPASSSTTSFTTAARSGSYATRMTTSGWDEGGHAGPQLVRSRLQYHTTEADYHHFTTADSNPNEADSNPTEADFRGGGYLLQGSRCIILMKVK